MLAENPSLFEMDTLINLIHTAQECGTISQAQVICLSLNEHLHTYVQVFILLLQTVCLSVFSQKATLSGKVFNKNTNEVIDFAYVYLDSIYTSTTTNESGIYSFSNLTAEKYKLCVSVLGYEKFSQKINLKPGINTINIPLQAKSFELSPIVITGTGTHHRIDKVPAPPMH